MITITEEMNVHGEWYKQARGMTWDSLPEFLRHLMEDYRHDYGTICHALSAGAAATAWAMNRHPAGGITGFQAGFVMWGFIRGWQMEEGPMRFVRFEDMLYPQYGYKFDKTISPDVWEYLQKQAARNLDKTAGVHPSVLAHWQSIAGGVVPFGYRVSDD